MRQFDIKQKEVKNMTIASNVEQLKYEEDTITIKRNSCVEIIRRKNQRKKLKHKHEDNIIVDPIHPQKKCP